jgi:broad specificity phosphatase PhoE
MIRDYTYWSLVVDPNQSTLGSAMILCKRSVKNFSELYQEEMNELKQLCGEYERALMIDFHPYQILYQTVEPFCILATPIYNGERIFTGKTTIEKALQDKLGKCCVTPNISLYILKSGATDWSTAGINEGWSDISLNEVGKKQTHDMKRVLDGFSFESCYCSDLPRAVETAGIIAEGRSMPVIADPRLRERNFAEWQGRLYFDYRRAHAKETTTVETVEAFLERLFSLFNEITAVHKDGSKVLVITHSNAMRVLTGKFLGFAKLDHEEMGIAYNSCVKAIYGDGKWRIDIIQHILLPQSIVFTSNF